MAASPRANPVRSVPSAMLPTGAARGQAGVDPRHVRPFDGHQFVSGRQERVDRPGYLLLGPRGVGTGPTEGSGARVVVADGGALEEHPTDSHTVAP